MLRISQISFPGLGIGEFKVDSVAFKIFGLEIAWYALLITIGMVCAIVYTCVQAKKIGVTFDDIIDFAIFTIPIGVIGARLYYVLSEIDQYHSLKDVFNIREGGLAIYGGIIAGALTVFVVSKVKKINFLALADCVAPGVLLAQGIGRWGNFMNGEAFGYDTNWFCRMGLNNYLTGFVTKYVHPTFLYESLWNLLGVLLVYLFGRYIKKKYDGQQFLMTFGWYGLGRMFIEGLRTDSLYIGNTGIRTSQLLAGIIFVICLALLVYFAIRKPTKALYYKQPDPNAKQDESLKESFEKIGNWFKGLVGKKTDKNSASEKDCKSEKSETDKENNTENKE